MVANRTPEETEELVVEVRRALAENPWAQVGASAIAWEMAKLGVDPVPPSRTIERILARRDVPRRSRRLRRQPKGKAYPEPAAGEANACHQADLVGPRYLEGGTCFYALNVVDVGRHKAASEIMTSKSSGARSPRRSREPGGASGPPTASSSTTSRRSSGPDGASARWCGSASPTA